MENLAQLKSLYIEDEKSKALVSSFNHDQPTVTQLKGLTGSSLAYRAMAAFKNQRDTQLFIFPNKEEAAYFQNDIQSLFDTKEILFFSDSFKKAGHFDRTERTNVLMRTEVVEKLFTRAHAKIGEIIITYPEALIEQVINKETFNERVDLLLKKKDRNCLETLKVLSFIKSDSVRSFVTPVN
mgnify:CR=1 FL=1